MYADIISKFENAKVLVIGDLMLDKYIYGKVERISPEAPVPIVHVSSEKYVPGGAANVANNIISFDAKAFLVGVIGDDASGVILLNELEKNKIDCSGIVKSKKIQTTQKIRVVAHNQQMVRIDYEDRHIEEDEQVCQKISQLIPKCDVIILSDYAKGTITKNIFDETKKMAKQHGKKIIVDPKPASKNIYENVFLITPNKKEAEELTKSTISNNHDVETALKIISKELNSNVLITRGEHGMSLFEHDRNLFHHMPTKAKKVFDVSGAGDTVIATLALSIASGASVIDSCEIANHAAGIVVGKLETATTNKEELSKSFNLQSSEHK